MRRTAITLTLVAGLAIGTSCAQGARSSAGPVAVPFVEPASTSRSAPVSATDAAIARHQARLRATPGDDGARLALAEAFLQKGREVADPTYATRAATLLDDLGRRRPDDPAVTVVRGGLALTRHEFERALELGRAAVTAAPGNAAALAVVVDAANELGRYDEAAEATQAMVDAKPNLASLARAAQARELRGDVTGAIRAMTQAVAAGPQTGEHQAYAEVQLGHLHLNAGDLAGAEAAYRAADLAFPGFAPAAAGRARLLVAQGQFGAAADVLADVVDEVPAPELLVAHADALAGAGRRDEVRDATALVGAVADLYASNGVELDVELVLLDADLGDEKAALERAEAAIESRPGIYSWDALAWARFRTGDEAGAATAMTRALALGTRDPQLRYHAAAIAAARGDRAAAVEHLQLVQASNPRFSARLWPEVSDLAARLGLGELTPSPGRERP